MAKARMPPEGTGQSNANLLGDVLTPLLLWGFMIPAVVLCAAKFQLQLFSHDTASWLNYCLDWVWPGVSRNYDKILELGYTIEANGYILLVTMVAVYSAGAIWVVIMKAYQKREEIPPFGGNKEIAALIVSGLVYLIFPRVYQVKAEFKSLADFYIDIYGVWIVTNYLTLTLIFIVPSLYIMSAVKLVRLAKANWRE